MDRDSAKGLGFCDFLESGVDLHENPLDSLDQILGFCNIIRVSVNTRVVGQFKATLDRLILAGVFFDV